MSARPILILANDRVRQRAVHWVMTAEPGTRVEFKKPRRTLDQNAKFWAMLGDIARQYTWHGVRMAPADWRLVFLDALDREMQIVPNLAGDGFVNLVQSSSDLTVGEMRDLIEILYAWGAHADHPVKWSEPDVYGHPTSAAREPALPNKRAEPAVPSTLEREGAGA
jgi:hypothetical protein